MANNERASQEKAMAHILDLAAALRKEQPRLTQEQAVAQVIADDPDEYYVYEVGARQDQRRADAAARAANRGE